MELKWWKKNELEIKTCDAVFDYFITLANYLVIFLIFNFVFL